ncbi:MAG: NAD+ synthase [Candidatus Omnitrophota bacterium]
MTNIKRQKPGFILKKIKEQRVEKIKENIINWIKQQVVQAKARGVVLGLSGGVDSAVCAALVKDVCEKNHQALILPCESIENDIKDAKLVADVLKLNMQLMDLTAVYTKLLEILPKGNLVAQGNLKARLRMTTLYYFANSRNFLVCGTGNRTELLLGYFTKYGDGGADILPIGDLFKHEVRQLAESVGIPKKIIKKRPSAGLWPGQTDEQELGLSYRELDDILSNLYHPKHISKKFKKVKGLIDKSLHKRQGAKIFYCKE